MSVPEGWLINPDWPSDTSGIVGYFHDESQTIHNRTLFVVDGWRFFLGGEGDVQLFPFRRGGVLVTVGGQGYLVRPADKSVLLPKLHSIDLRSSTYVESHDIVVSLVDYGASVVAFGPAGVVWENRSHYIHDVESLEVVDNALRIETYCRYDQQLWTVVLDLETGQELTRE